MEKTTLEALGWQVGKGMAALLPHFLFLHPQSLCSSARSLSLSGDMITPKPETETPHLAHITVKRRFQFSSALKRMSTVSVIVDAPSASSNSTKAKKSLVVSVKGAPETIKKMLAVVPDEYDQTFKYFTRRGSRVLALGTKTLDMISDNQVRCVALVSAADSQADGLSCLNRSTISRGRRSSLS